MEAILRPAGQQAALATFLLALFRDKKQIAL
jgi:hypothetical protein